MTSNWSTIVSLSFLINFLIHYLTCWARLPPPMIFFLLIGHGAAAGPGPEPFFCVRVRRLCWRSYKRRPLLLFYLTSLCDNIHAQGGANYPEHILQPTVFDLERDPPHDQHALMLHTSTVKLRAHVPLETLVGHPFAKPLRVFAPARSKSRAGRQPQCGRLRSPEVPLPPRPHCGGTRNRGSRRDRPWSRP